MAAAQGKQVPEEVKKMVRSVLLSVVGGIKVTEFHREYKKITDEPIMWKKLGFRNLIELFQAMPDVARCMLCKSMLLQTNCC